MSDSSNSPGFVFNDKIDPAQLYALYEYDYQWVEEIFQTTLEHFDGDVGNIDKHLNSGDLPELKRALHKIKPTFGFIGMAGMQERCKHAEDSAASATSIDQVRPEIQQLLIAIGDCKTAIQDDYNRLRLFNTKQ